MVEQPDQLSDEVRKILEEEAAVAEIEVAIDAALEEGIEVTTKEVIDTLKEKDISTPQTE